MEEIDLINSAIKIGDPEAWRYIYNRCYRAVKQTLFRLGCKEQDTEDLAHQTFVKILNSKSKPHFENTKLFYSWLIRVVKTVVYDVAKSKANHNEQITEYYEDLDILTFEVPQEIVINSQINLKIKNALAKLTDNEQKLLIMRTDNTPYEQISVETGIPLNGIRTVFKRTVIKMQKNLVDEGLTQ